MTFKVKNNLKSILFSAVVLLAPAFVFAAPLIPQTILIDLTTPSSAMFGSTFSVTGASNLPVDITVTGGCTISTTVSDIPGGKSTSGTVTMTSSVDSCVVHYNQAGDETYAPAPEITETVTAKKRSITVTAQPNSKAYDGNTSAGATPVVAGGLIGTDTANFIETYENAEAGTNKVLIPSGIVNDGNGGNNYDYTFVNNNNGEIYVVYRGGGGGGILAGSYVTPVVAPVVPEEKPVEKKEEVKEEKIGEVLGVQVFKFTKTLRKGSKGNEVTELQKFLTNAKYYTGKIDGIFGLATRAAVIKFQIANGIMDGFGTVGPKTRALLNK